MTEARIESMEVEKQRDTPNLAAGEDNSAGEANDNQGNGSAGDHTSPAQVAVESSPAYQKVLAEKQELYDRLLRKQAELENFRKRVQKEKEDFLHHANADLIRTLLPALDAFERALKQRDPAAPQRFYEGLELIHRQLMDALGRAGLKTVEAQGKPFDPALHQAVETVEAEENHQDQEVVEELQRGYQLRHRLLRPAVVKVAVHGQNKAGEHSPVNSSGSD
jgi:molecular chaperone GrpE